MERELAGSRNPSPKKNTRKSLVECNLTDLGYEECEDENDEIETEPTDETKTPMSLLDALRALPRGAKQPTKAKYDEPGLGLSLLKFYFEERVPTRRRSRSVAVCLRTPRDSPCRGRHYRPTRRSWTSFAQACRPSTSRCSSNATATTISSSRASAAR